MSSERWPQVWERVRAGQHTVVIGPEQRPPVPSDLHLLWVNCAVPQATTGPLDEAQRQLDKLLGLYPLTVEPLDDAAGQAFAGRLVETANRLADWENGCAALYFMAVDAADPATLATLASIIKKPGWLRLPLVLAVRRSQADAATELIAAVRADGDAEAVIELAPANKSPPEPVAASGRWNELPPGALRVLRAGAIIGSEFDAELIGRLLDKPTAAVLEQLQRAADAGVALSDHGEGRFMLPQSAVDALREGVLPSLRTHWHRRLGELLSTATAEPAAALPTPVAEPNSAARQTKIPASFADLFEQSLSEPPQDQTEPDRAERKAAVVPEPAPATAASTAAARSADPLRAADHLQAAGHPDDAAARYLDAAHQLAARGDVGRAYLAAQQGLALLATLPTSDGRALLRARLLLALGQLQWQGYGHGETFTLGEALKSLRAARAALPARPPAELLGQLATATAGVCYDLGDQPSLQQALAELTAAGQQLLAAGAALPAARLLSAQAALYVRLGDPVQATRLLDRAQPLLQQQLADSQHRPLVLAELAQIHHLLARLPLHAPLRSGSEPQALAIALEHAAAAEAIGSELNDLSRLGRVWETMGRLERLRGQIEPAQQRLSGALALQQRTGDVTGLARSSAALAELYADAGRLTEALTLLADSITLNREKGSPVGLAFNRQTLARLAAAIDRQGAEGEPLRRQAAALEHRLAQAETLFGRLPLRHA